MKKRIMTFIILQTICIAWVYAQITLNDPGIPSIGIKDTSTSYSFTPIGNFREAGANVIWDFSNLVVTDSISEYIEIVDLSSSNNPTKYSSANYVGKTMDGEFYSLISNQEHHSLGFEGSDFRVNYLADPRLVSKYPMTYNDEFQDTFSAIVIIQGTQINRTGTVVIKADGYGDLIMPYGTVSNVLRVLTVTTWEDEISGTVSTAIDSTYNWEALSEVGPTISIFYNDGVRSSFEGSYSDPSPISTAVGKDESIENLITIYPNPANDYLSIEIAIPTTISIFNLQGQMVKKLPMLQGRQKIDISDLDKGTYLLNIKTKNNIVTKKIVIN